MLQVQQLLAAAPEALKALGLAYRAFVMSPCSSNLETASNAAVEAPSSDAADTAVSCAVEAQQQLLHQLSKSYRMYISQPAEYEASGVSSSMLDGCNAYATAVLGLSASVVLLLPHAGERGSLASQHAAAAGLLGCLPLLLTAVRRGLPLHCVGQLGRQEQQELLAAAAAAGWPEQVGGRSCHLQALR
jgi:hypothetical protein